MTRKEAIKELNDILEGFKNVPLSKTALEMAIASLETDEAYQLEYERTTKNDLGVDAVSRQAAIDAIRRIHPIDTDYDCTLYDKVDVMYVLNDLPSVTPQEPRWIPVSERLPDTEDKVLCWYEYYHWSKEKILPEYGIGQYIVNEWYGEVSHGLGARVIAWQPLPEHYKMVEPQESEDT